MFSLLLLTLSFFLAPLRAIQLAELDKPMLLPVLIRTFLSKPRKLELGDEPACGLVIEAFLPLAQTLIRPYGPAVKREVEIPLSDSELFSKCQKIRNSDNDIAAFAIWISFYIVRDSHGDIYDGDTSFQGLVLPFASSAKRKMSPRWLVSYRGGHAATRSERKLTLSASLTGIHGVSGLGAEHPLNRFAAEAPALRVSATGEIRQFALTEHSLGRAHFLLLMSFHDFLLPHLGSKNYSVASS